MKTGSRRAAQAVALLALFAVSVWFATAAAQTTLRLYTEEYPPISFERGGHAAGLASEVVLEIQRRVHSDATIEVVPWARGYRSATTEPFVGLFATTRTPEREPLFKWVGPVSATTGQFYTRRGAPGLRSLDQARAARRIVVPREWYLHQLLREMGFSNLLPVPTPADALRMLSAGRAEVAALDDITVADSAAETGVVVADIERGPTITRALQFIAFSKGTPDDLVRRWQQALDEMRADGSYERIYRRWLPGSTPPPAR